MPPESSGPEAVRNEKRVAVMWSTIANFKDNLTQIASDVLDTADELKRAQGDYDDEDFGSHDPANRSSYSDKESDLKAELEWYRNEVPRLQAAESAIQSTCTNHVSVLKDKEDELFRTREENRILKEKLSSESASQTDKLREALEKQAADLQDYHKQRYELLIAQHKEEIANARELSDHRNLLVEKIAPSTSNGSVPYLSQDDRLEELETQVHQLQRIKKDLSSQLSEKDDVYEKLRDAYDSSLSEVRQLEEQSAKDREVSLQRDSQLQRDRAIAEASTKEIELLRQEHLKISRELAELQKTVDEQNGFGKTIQELRLSVANLETDKADLEEERDRLLKTLKDRDQAALEIASIETATGSVNVVKEADLLTVKEAAAEVDRLTERVREAEEASASQKLVFEARVENLLSERDKAIRDLGRLRQHLLDKERADSEKMDQDSEQIADLQARADMSQARAAQAEQSLAVAQADLRETQNLSKEQLSRAAEDITILQQKLANCITGLESKDVELSNLQSALGQYYAESEAQDRLYLELRTAKEERALLSQQLQNARQTIELKNGERDAALDKLALTEDKSLQSQQKIRKLDEEVIRLRRALEQSMTRLNSLSSDSDHHVDRRIVIKLLVTYFQRNHSREVLDLMVRMLGFSEEEKKRVGVAQRAAGGGVVRGVLGLPGRFVGGIIGSASPDLQSLPSPSEDKSFADLWIDFLLKESEERERREKAAAIEEAEMDMGRDENTGGKAQAAFSSVSSNSSLFTPPSPSHVSNHRHMSSFSNTSSNQELSPADSHSIDNVELAPQLAGM